MKKLKALIVEDEPAIAELLELQLAHHGFVCELCPTAELAMAAMNAQLPDIVLLDWMLPGMSGIALARQWRSAARTQQVPILMLTARSEEADKVQGLDSGADDYLTKPFSTQELLARVRAILRRRSPEQASAPLKCGHLELDNTAYRVAYKEQELKLGPTEFKILRYLMSAPERVHSRAQLLDKVWGDHVFIEERTVDVHIKRLRESLGEAGHLIETVRGVGYRMNLQKS